MESAGYPVDNNELLEKIKGTSWRSVQESELLEVLRTILRPSPSVRSEESLQHAAN